MASEGGMTPGFLPNANESGNDAKTDDLSDLPLSPSSPTASWDFDQGSHDALKKAFFSLKQRLEGSDSQKRLLIQKIRTLQSAVDCAPGTGWAAKMDAASGGIIPEAGLQQAAEEGFTNNLQRQLVRARTQLQAVEAKYQEKVEENDVNQSTLKQQLNDALALVERLTQEKTTLEQMYDDEKQEKETALQLVKELGERCNSLQLEKEKVIKEAAILHSSLRKVSGLSSEAHEDAMLKEKRGGVMQRGVMQGEINPAELTAEVAQMRHVIRKLKEMVLDQKRQLGNCGRVLSMSSLSRSTPGASYPHLLLPPSLPSTSITTTTPPLSSAGRSASTQSWEMVNPSPFPPSLNTLQQQKQQQQQQLRAMQQRCVTSASSTLNPYWAQHNMAANMATNMATHTMKPPATAAANGTPPKMHGSQSAVIQRNSYVPLPPKSRTEVLKPATGDFTDSSFQFLGGGRTFHHPPGSQDTAGGLNYLGEVSEAGVTSPTRPAFPFGGAVDHSAYLPQVMKGHPQAVGSYSPNKTTPSMHILNPGIMAGARVIRNDSDSFGNSGGMVVMAPPVQSGGITPTHLNKESSHRPQEHDDGTFTAAMPELSPVNDRNYLNAPVINPAQSGSDSKCPVCGQDFSHISMDEFQTHVFECFDNAEENASALQTLQPEQDTGKGQVCPMCEKRFSEATAQEYFEGHVQSHFEEITEQFEVLEVKEP
ncbi:hypothetical protein ACOMHN_030260 [Nucella lapillus]